MSKIPARCNRRTCQGRRNIDAKYLNAAPEQMPTCTKCGEGRMYVDRYRLKGLDAQHQPRCTDPHCPLNEVHALANNGRTFAHTTATRGCTGYADYVANSAINDSKHKPFRDNEPTKEAPF